MGWFQTPLPNDDNRSRISQLRDWVRSRIKWLLVTTVLASAIGYILIPRIFARDTPSVRNELRELVMRDGENLIVFVHGIREAGQETWSDGKKKKNEEKLLAQDDLFDSFDLMSFHYSSMLFDGSNITISNAADQLAQRLDENLIEEYEQVIFVAHSMGGIVVRNLLLNYDRISQKVPLVYFLATPTTGSHLARIGTALQVPSRQLRALTSLEQSNFLEGQSTAWRARSDTMKIISLCAFETRRTRGVIVVDRASAQSLCDGVPIPTEETHSGIAKPHTKESLIYKALADQWRVLSEQRTGSERVVSEAERKHLAFVGDLHVRNPVRDDRYRDRLTTMLMNHISEIPLSYQDRLTFRTAGEASVMLHLDPDWNREIALTFRGAQPGDVPDYIVSQMDALTELPRHESSELVWALNELSSQIDCAREDVTVYVISNVFEAVQVADQSVTMRQFQGQPFVGCREVVFLGIGASWDGDQQVVTALQSVVRSAMLAAGFDDISFLR